MQIIKKLLLQTIADIDAGNSNLTADEEIKLLEAIKYLTTKDEGMSKYSAC